MPGVFLYSVERIRADHPEVTVRIQLDLLEQRVIGCLLEKQITTPDQYPLSLNALVAACNQKSNRDPVLTVDEPTVQRTIDALARKHLVLERAGFGSRVPKYQQLFCNTEYGSLKFTPQELAIVSELLLRGPQTPGELRSRASRMAAFSDVTVVEGALQALADREEGPLVVRLPREPGRRESRYRHLFGNEPAPVAAEVAEPADPADAAFAAASSTPGGVPPTERDGLASRVAVLEEAVRQLRAQLDELNARGR